MQLGRLPAQDTWLHGRSIAWSPDGDSLVHYQWVPYSSPHPGGEDGVFLRDLVAGSSAQIAACRLRAGPTWSPDGLWIAAFGYDCGGAPSTGSAEPGWSVGVYRKDLTQAVSFGPVLPAPESWDWYGAYSLYWDETVGGDALVCLAGESLPSRCYRLPSE
jgi:hypothetical protein